MIILFIAFAIGALLGALILVGAKNPVHSALGLVATLISTSALYALLHAPFLAMVQVAIYAGAIMVVFIFVTMLLNVGAAGGSARGPLRVQASAITIAALFAAAIGAVVWRFAPAAIPPTVPDDFGSTADLGTQLLGPLTLPFEAASLLLLVAMVGAIVLAQRGRE